MDMMATTPPTRTAHCRRPRLALRGIHRDESSPGGRRPGRAARPPGISAGRAAAGAPDPSVPPPGRWFPALIHPGRAAPDATQGGVVAEVVAIVVPVLVVPAEQPRGVRRLDGWSGRGQLIGQ